jgi:hypothetical protein
MPNDQQMRDEFNEAKKKYGWATFNQASAAWEAWQAALSTRPQPAVSEWRPIGEAPKDGTQILAYWEYYGCEVISWFPDWEGEGKGSWVLYGSFGNKFYPSEFHETPPYPVGEPTHFMPLPPAPKGGDDAE